MSTKAKSTKIEYVLELTKEEAQGLSALVGGTTGDIGWDVYSALGEVLNHREAATRFPDLEGKGRFS